MRLGSKLTVTYMEEELMIISMTFDNMKGLQATVRTKLTEEQVVNIFRQADPRGTELVDISVDFDPDEVEDYERRYTRY